MSKALPSLEQLRKLNQSMALGKIWSHGTWPVLFHKLERRNPQGRGGIPKSARAGLLRDAALGPPFSRDWQKHVQKHLAKAASASGGCAKLNPGQGELGIGWLASSKKNTIDPPVPSKGGRATCQLKINPQPQRLLDLSMAVSLSASQSQEGEGTRMQYRASVCRSSFCHKSWKSQTSGFLWEKRGFASNRNNTWVPSKKRHPAKSLV